MSPELISISLQVALAAVKYGKKIDVLKAGREVLTEDLVLPVADPLTMVDIPVATLRNHLKEYIHGSDDAQLIAIATELLADEENFASREAQAFLLLVAPERIPEYIRLRAKGAKEGMTGRDVHGVMLLKSNAVLPKIAGQIVVIATEFLASAAFSFAPHVIGDEGVEQLVTSALKHFLADTGTSVSIENWSEELARRAFNAGMNALATDSGALKGRSDVLDLGFEFVTALKGGMGSETDWRIYAKTFFDDGGFVRFVGALGKAASSHLSAESERTLKEFVSSLTTDLVNQMTSYKGSSKTFLKNHWNELVAGGLKTISEHSDALLPGQREWIRLVVKASSGALAEIAKERSFDGAAISRSLVSQVSAAFIAKPEVLVAGINEKGLRNLILSALTPLASESGLSDTGKLKVELASRVVGGLVDLAAGDAQLRAKIFPADGAAWIEEFSTQFRVLADDESLKGIFSEEGRKKLGVSLVNATLKTVANRKADLIEGAGDEWLKIVVASLVDAAGSTSFETLLGKGGVRSFISSAVTAAEKNPTLIGVVGDELRPLLPVILGGIRRGIEGTPLKQNEIAALLVEAFEDWLVVRKEVARLDLQRFITSLSASIAAAARGPALADPALLSDVISIAAKGLVQRIDANHLVRPETLAIALGILFQQNLSPGDLLFAVGKVSSDLLGALTPEALQVLGNYNSSDWEALLRKHLEPAIAAITSTNTNLKTALLIARIDQAIVDISLSITPAGGPAPLA